MDSFKLAKELHDDKGQDCQYLEGHVLKKCLDDVKRSNDIHRQSVCVEMVYKVSLEYDKESGWGDFAGMLIVRLIEELKKYTNHIRKLQAQNDELQKRNNELDKRIDVLEKTTAKPQGDDMFTRVNKAAKCLQDPKHILERLEILSIEKRYKRQRTVIDGLKEKKANLKKELEQVDESDKEEQLKHCIEFISKQIDARTRVGRGLHEAGCDRVKTLNEFAFKRLRDQDKRLQEAKSKVGNNLKKAQNSANAVI